MERSVLHIDMDTFFVSVERLINSKLNGKPVIVGGVSDRGVVSSCSYEARVFGVRSAMPVRMALRLCPDAIVIRGDMDLYTKYSRCVTDIIAERAPLYEKRSIDEHYIDLTGMDRFHGCSKWTGELRNYILRETGLPVSAGLSVNKTVSKIATGEAKPNGIKEVVQSMVHPFLDPLPVGKIPMIGPKTSHLLKSMGVPDIHTLRQIPPDMMERLMGRNGIEIWRRANGIDSTPVVAYSEQDSLSSEHTFQKDTTDLTVTDALITGMTEKLTFRLRGMNKLTSCLTVKIRYSDYETHTLQKRMPYTSFDHELIPAAKELMRRVYSRRVLIRLIGVKLSNLVQGSRQLDLFTDSSEMARLYNTIDTLKKKFGKDAVGRAEGVIWQSRRDVS